MPTSFDYTVQINAAPGKVFAYISEFSNHGAWYENPWRIENVSSGATGAGSTFRSIADDPFGREIMNEITVSEFKAPTRFCFRCKDPHFTQPTLHEFTLSSQAGGTFVERKVTFNAPFPLNIIIPVIIEPFMGRPSMLRSMNRLKAAMEAQPAAK